MDDIQIILYIAFAVIAILVRAFKSKNKEQQPGPSQGTDEGGSREEQPSFEDLLKEFTGEKDVEEHKKWQQAPIEENEYEGDDDEAQRVYEESVRKARGLKSKELVAEGDDDRHTGSFQHFRGYEEDDEDVPNEFIEMLQDAEGAKKAIILSEIINKKY